MTSSKPIYFAKDPNSLLGIKELHQMYFKEGPLALRPFGVEAVDGSVNLNFILLGLAIQKISQSLHSTYEVVDNLSRDEQLQYLKDFVASAEYLLLRSSTDLMLPTFATQMLDPLSGLNTPALKLLMEVFPDYANWGILKNR